MTELAKKLALPDASTLVVSNIVGTGIFFTSGFVAQSVPDAVALLGAWLLGGALALAGALCYAELGAAMPRSGGSYHYLKEAFGLPVAFLSGWVSMFAGFSGPIAAGALAFAAFFGGGDPWTERAVAVAAIGGLALVQLTPRAWLGVQRWLTYVKYGVLLVLVVAGVLAPPAAATWVASGSVTLAGLGAALVPVMYCYSGWDAATYVGAEVHRPERDLVRALVLGTAAAVLLYLLANTFYLNALPLGVLAETQAVGDAAARALFGDAAGRVVAAAIALSVLGSVNAMLILGPRVLFAMARERQLPSILDRVDARTKTPLFALALIAGFACVLVLVSTLKDIITYAGYLLVAVSGLTVVGLMVLRRTRKELARPFRVPGYPLVPAVFVGFSGYMLYASARFDPTGALWGLGILAAGAVCYPLMRRFTNTASG